MYSSGSLDGKLPSNLIGNSSLGSDGSGYTLNKPCQIQNKHVLVLSFSEVNDCHGQFARVHSIIKEKFLRVVI